MLFLDKIIKSNPKMCINWTRTKQHMVPWSTQSNNVWAVIYVKCNSETYAYLQEKIHRAIKNIINFLRLQMTIIPKIDLDKQSIVKL